MPVLLEGCRFCIISIYCFWLRRPIQFNQSGALCFKNITTKLKRLVFSQGPCIAEFHDERIAEGITQRSWIIHWILFFSEKDKTTSFTRLTNTDAKLSTRPLATLNSSAQCCFAAPRSPPPPPSIASLGRLSVPLPPTAASAQTPHKKVVHPLSLSLSTPRNLVPRAATRFTTFPATVIN
ncbi:hypothetical protein VHEMI03405 [[Torrubiella] hemipterigena]|uniref:Uncharacterized protein n=1 Tax=[Torrubiella] hemipterigena TaxID=1531966 RepID=A0A0A1TAQ1_9HYPO|nr:hypothetical protein VHEMI03405 [[Torrubiella] hemipterigena]